MFSLIITIISIALVAALALATLYYGGSAFNRGSQGAIAAQLINEGQQVNGAVAVAKADAAAGGTEITTWQGLVTATPNPYLAQLPSGLKLTGGDAIGNISTELTYANAKEVCEEIQRRATGSTAIPEAAITNQVYGCWDANTAATPGGYTFVYKV